MAWVSAVHRLPSADLNYGFLLTKRTIKAIFLFKKLKVFENIRIFLDIKNDILHSYSSYSLVYMKGR